MMAKAFETSCGAKYSKMVVPPQPVTLLSLGYRGTVSIASVAPLLPTQLTACPRISISTCFLIALTLSTWH